MERRITIHLFVYFECTPFGVEEENGNGIRFTADGGRLRI
jgi:hypothetical protein